ncbi:MAG: Heavy metal transport/detoxification protein [Bacteroidota bacterium]|nr:Heavy metal transport/detoxification protein [Bacteroidota bacterium]
MKKHAIHFLSATALIFILSFGLKAAVMPKGETVTIQTSAICESCKKRIEKVVKATDGVMEANLNLNNKKLKVKYDSAVISPDQIRTAIANSGYDADYIKKNDEAFNKLPKCCQHPEDGKH